MIMVISIITFIMTFIGVRIGNVVGIKYEKKAQVIGGLILISLSIKNSRTKVCCQVKQIPFDFCIECTLN